MISGGPADALGRLLPVFEVMCLMWRHRLHQESSSSSPEAGILVVEGSPVRDHPHCVGLAVNAVTMDALLFQRPDHTFTIPFCCGQRGVMNSCFST